MSSTCPVCGKKSHFLFKELYPPVCDNYFGVGIMINGCVGCCGTPWGFDDDRIYRYKTRVQLTMGDI